MRDAVVVDEEQGQTTAGEAGDRPRQRLAPPDFVTRELDARRGGAARRPEPDQVQRRAFRGGDEAQAQLRLDADFARIVGVEALEGREFDPDALKRAGAGGAGQRPNQEARAAVEPADEGARLVDRRRRRARGARLGRRGLGAARRRS